MKFEEIKKELVGHRFVFTNKYGDRTVTIKSVEEPRERSGDGFYTLKCENDYDFYVNTEHIESFIKGEKVTYITPQKGSSSIQLSRNDILFARAKEALVGKYVTYKHYKDFKWAGYIKHIEPCPNEKYGVLAIMSIGSSKSEEGATLSFDCLEGLLDNGEYNPNDHIGYYAFENEEEFNARFIYSQDTSNHESSDDKWEQRWWDMFYAFRINGCKDNDVCVKLANNAILSAKKGVADFLEGGISKARR